MPSEEETRAALFRAEMVSRAKYVASNRVRLRGSSSARLALLEHWRPWWEPQPTVVEPVSFNDPTTNAD